MIIAFLIAIIGIIPIVLAISVVKIYRGSELAVPLLLYMLSISCWQLDIAVLYLKGTFSEELILWLFKIFRAGPTFMIPLVFYLSYAAIKKHSTNLKNNLFYRFLIIIFNRKVLILLSIWSLFVYIVNMTDLGIRGLQEIQIINSNTYFYFPEYGPLKSLYSYHTSSFIMFLGFSYIISRNLQNKYLKDFLATFSFCSFLLFVSGLLNFIPGTGALYSSLGVIIFSVIIIFAFLKMNTAMVVNYNRLIERQKKLDYTGNLTASLVHEVKNSLVIIMGYSKLFSELPSIPQQGKKMVDMIHKAARQIDNLTYNYTKFIKHESIDYRMADLNEIVEQSIELSAEITKGNAVGVSFERKYKTLKAYINETYIKQVFVNLIKNSTEAMPNERTLRTIKITTNIDMDKIIINVIDTGKGIPIENWESIFDPFTSNKEEGLGLGLPFVKKIIFEHRGDIKVVDSNPNGTHIQILLPQYSFSDF
ncbi:sensor histidine kinase [Metabacillus sediminilitoris]|uniref:histidine kinase n=1 Tax=Metabacillus sediminilitoris TaxID=2567941 RepID=A0A4S4BJN2_9BACI|nr:ATP-binding protein [Metabacillus sediminilitoris]QGQ45064.1 GHKL domain-containing protein [Metabacillus sediminilitoris]THF74655.1 GHKL domain-containing protein [Metabacillus sediminilitoris]